MTTPNKDDYYCEVSAGVLVAVVDRRKWYRWWSDQLEPADRPYVKKNYPLFDINRRRFIRT